MLMGMIRELLSRREEEREVTAELDDLLTSMAEELRLEVDEFDPLEDVDDEVESDSSYWEQRMGFDPEAETEPLPVIPAPVRSVSYFKKEEEYWLAKPEMRVGIAISLLVIIAICALLLSGCNNSDGRAAFPVRPTFTSGNVEVFLPVVHTPSERQRAVYAVREYQNVLAQLVPVLPPPMPISGSTRRRLYIYTTPRMQGGTCRTGEFGYTDPKNGEMHVVAGTCWELPDLLHQLIHSFYDPDCYHQDPWWGVWFSVQDATSDYLIGVFKTRGWCP